MVARQENAKQLIVSTCDKSLYYLMMRKFRLAFPAERDLIAVTLDEDLENGIGVTYDVGGPTTVPATAG